jgi:hypothetical protein
MLSGNVRQFSVERLMRFLVEIRLRHAQASHPRSARITVIAT